MKMESKRWRAIGVGALMLAASLPLAAGSTSGESTRVRPLLGLAVVLVPVVSHLATVPPWVETPVRPQEAYHRRQRAEALIRVGRDVYLYLFEQREMWSTLDPRFADRLAIAHGHLERAESIRVPEVAAGVHFLEESTRQALLDREFKVINLFSSLRDALLPPARIAATEDSLAPEVLNAFHLAANRGWFVGDHLVGLRDVRASRNYGKLFTDLRQIWSYVAGGLLGGQSGPGYESWRIIFQALQAPLPGSLPPEGQAMYFGTLSQQLAAQSQDLVTHWNPSICRDLFSAPQSLSQNSKPLR